MPTQINWTALGIIIGFAVVVFTLVGMGVRDFVKQRAEKPEDKC